MAETPDEQSYTPRFATLIALAVFLVFVTILCLPMFSGNFLGGETSDQTWTGIAFREFWRHEFQRTGHVPLWNPYLFGGMPFVAAMHGDIFYPTSFLRIVFNAATTLNFVFWSHLVLAGLFTYVFLRTLRTSWTAAVIGGLAYQLSGAVASQVSPGHDGKLAVSALLPLLLTGLVLGIRRRRMEGYALVALMVGLDILTPQVQMSQYSLILAGCFTLYLCFFDQERPAEPKQRWQAMGWATLAVALGFGMSMIQILPFIKYGPFAARVAGNRGWDYATSYAMPPENIVDWLVATFTGNSMAGTYWGSNGFKLNSEYVGAAVIVLAIVGVASLERRKTIKFLAGMALLFTLVALGGHTPFYRLWYAIVPGVKVTRAAGMAFFIPTFIFSCFAAFGVERLQKGEGRKALFASLIGAGVLLLFAASGALARMAAEFAGERFQTAEQAASSIAIGGVLAAVFAAAAAGIGMAALKGRLNGPALAGLLVLVVGADGFISAGRYFHWTPIRELYADDEITRHLEQLPMPYRMMDLPGQNGVYSTSFLMGKGIPNAMGHHGNEMHAYDQLLGGKEVWSNAASPRMFDLLAVRFITLPMQVQITGYHQAMYTRSAVSGGQPHEGFLYEADTVPPYARVVPAAVKADEDRFPATIMDPRWNHNRIVLLPPDAPVTAVHLDSVPPAMAARATVTAWEPGAMTVRMDPAPEHDAFLVVAENWYPDWHGTVDGQPAQVLRGQRTLITVPVRQGAHEVKLWFHSAAYGQGKMITLVSLLAIAAWFVVPVVRRKRSG